jgi:hypothetical protein
MISVNSHIISTRAVIEMGEGWRKGGKKRRVEEHLVALKVSELQHGGALAEGVAGAPSWNQDGRSLAQIGFRTTATEFIITYGGASAKPVEERVALERVAAGFGGRRLYFRCPDPTCGRRVMALYLAGELFRCRHCHGLAYASQGEDARRRARRRADKARSRLRYPEWRPFKVAPLVRPKGMWQGTFWHLQSMVLTADYAADEAFVSGLLSLGARIDRRVDRRRSRRHPVDETDEIVNAGRLTRLRALADRVSEQISRRARKV